MDEHTEPDLDILGVLEGTDKSSSVTNAWDYLRHYQRLFAHWRDKPINLIEIGVEYGPSLNVWRKYFTQATIVGIDIDPACARLAGDRVVIEIGSQDDPGFLYKVCAKYPPSIIIDDGSHFAHSMVYSFKRLFPMLVDGGLYVVEDIAFHFGSGSSRWAGDGKISAPEYFIELARNRMSNQPLTEANNRGDDRYNSEHIDSVSFIGGAVVIRKKKPRDVASSLAFAEQQMSPESSTSSQYLRLSEYTLLHGGPPDHAERLVRSAIRIGGADGDPLRLLADALTRQGRLEEAADATRQAANLRPDDASAWARLGAAEWECGRVIEAIAAMEKGSSIAPENVHFHDRLSYMYQQKGDFSIALASARQALVLKPDSEHFRNRALDLAHLCGLSK
jgi:Tfp pilus assembly protein PilF